MEWEIEFLPAAVKELASLAQPVRKRVGERIDRLRTGSYRILYRVRDRVVSVLIVKVGHRRDIYRGL